MTYQSELISRVEGFIGEDQNEKDRESANLIRLELRENRSGASYLSHDLLKHMSNPEFFSGDYIDFIKNYDIRRLMDEGLDFGEALTVVANVDDLRNHQVQFREGVSGDDFGGLNGNEKYQRIEVIMNYPDDAKLIEYIKQRFADKFRNSEVVFSPR